MSTTRNTGQPDKPKRTTKPVPSAERPLTARSVLASALLGETLPRLPVAQLMRIAAAFEINENRARVALSRMSAQGEVRSTGGKYELIGASLLARQRRQAESQESRTRPWSGSWLLAIVAPEPTTPEVRAARRVELSRARFGEYRDGVWVRPDNLVSELLARPDVHIVRSLETPETPETTPSFAAAVPRLWDLDGWTIRADQLSQRLRTTDPSTPTNLAPGFVLSASCLRHFQADPLLPTQLLPPTWPGASLRAQYSEWNSQYRKLLRSAR